MRLLLLALLAAAPPTVPPPGVAEDPIVVQARNDCGPRYAQLYVAPMGQPVRVDHGVRDPAGDWFAAADADHDGRVTLAEFTADAQRFFGMLDTDRDGEIAPDEISYYENQMVPEIKLYQPGQDRRPRSDQQRREANRAARARADYVAPYGAGLYSSLNIPEPVVSADLDINRGVSRQEFTTVAASRFAMLDPQGSGALTYAALPRSPAQQEIDACYAAAAKK